MVHLSVVKPLSDTVTGVPVSVGASTRSRPSTPDGRQRRGLTPQAWRWSQIAETLSGAWVRGP
jgi:hypothetical protein